MQSDDALSFPPPCKLECSGINCSYFLWIELFLSIVPTNIASFSLFNREPLTAQMCCKVSPGKLQWYKECCNTLSSTVAFKEESSILRSSFEDTCTEIICRVEEKQKLQESIYMCNCNQLIFSVLWIMKSSCSFRGRF